MRKRLSKILFVLFITIQAAHYASAEDKILAFPMADFEAKYKIEAKEEKFFPLDRFELVREKKDTFLVKHKNGHVVSIPKYKEGRRKAILDGNLVSFLTVTYETFTTGYYIFEKKKPLPVAKESGDKIVLLYNVNGEEKKLPLPKKYFSIKGKKQMEEEKRKRMEARRIAKEEKQKRMQERAQNQGGYQTGGFGDGLELKKPSASESFLAWDKEARETSEVYHATPITSEITKITDPLNAVCIIETENGVGTGFLGALHGRVYVFTNLHVIAYPERLKIRLSNRPLDYVGIEIAKERDLARILLKPGETEALAFAPEIELNKPITIYGNEEGAGVIKFRKGRITGAGYDIIEISAYARHGNSGGPIINEAGDVVGVVTHAFQSQSPEQWASNRRYNRTGNVRYFGTKVDNNVTWVPLHPKAMKKAGKLIAEASDRLANFIQFYDDNEYYFKYHHNSSPKNLSFITSHPALRDWIKTHNRYVRSYKQVRNDRSIDYKDRQAREESIKTRIQRHCTEELGNIYRKEGRQLRAARITPEIEYYTNQFDMLANLFDASSEMVFQ